MKWFFLAPFIVLVAAIIWTFYRETRSARKGFCDFCGARSQRLYYEQSKEYMSYETCNREICTIKALNSAGFDEDGNDERP